MDNTDLLHIDLTKTETVDKVHKAIQASVNSWGNLLVATGGALQPSECFYSIIFFECINGAWTYASNKDNGEFGVTVPLPGGGKAGIGHSAVSHAEKTLGAMTSPDEDSQAAIVMIQEKVQQWVNNVRNGYLHQRNVWFLLKAQLWPRIGYGICSYTATFEELSTALHWQYYQILPLGKIVRTTTVESRTIDLGFYGMRLPHLGVEALITMSNKLLMHYGCNTATGKFMQVRYSLFLVELGISFQPLQKSYSKYGFLSTQSWMKMLWEKISMFGVKIVVAKEALKYPWEGD